MAEFQSAFEKMLPFEGEYANDPSDRGGETYRGIARRYHPHWPGWQVIDKSRTTPRFPGLLAGNRRLSRAVEKLYREHYWNPLGGDEILDQAVAEVLFDAAVQHGGVRAARLLQEALNLLNRDVSGKTDLAIDGRIGRKTLRAISAAIDRDGSDQPLIELFALLRGEALLNTLRADRTQKRFLRGWLVRIKSRFKPGR
jgi:lysozyme family protein